MKTRDRKHAYTQQVCCDCQLAMAVEVTETDCTWSCFQTYDFKHYSSHISIYACILMYIYITFMRPRVFLLWTCFAYKCCTVYGNKGKLFPMLHVSWINFHTYLTFRWTNKLAKPLCIKQLVHFFNITCTICFRLRGQSS